MNGRHPPEEWLNEFIDGTLPSAETARLEDHLKVCADCRHVVADLERLVRRAESLPEIRPSRDLLPAIRRDVGASAHGHLRWIGAAAAAVLLIAVIWFAAQPADEDPALLADGGVDAELAEAERQYIEAAERLMAVLEARRDELPARALAELDENLTIIDQAIDESRQALSTGRADSADGHRLAALYDKKLTILWQASRLATKG